MNFFAGCNATLGPSTPFFVAFSWCLRVVCYGYLRKSLLTPQIARNHPKRKFSRKSGVAQKSPRNSYWIHTKRHTKPHWIPLSSPEFSLKFRGNQGRRGIHAISQFVIPVVLCGGCALKCAISCVAIGPAPHRVSRALRARNPGRVRKEYPGAGPQKCQKSAPRSLKRVRKESKTWLSDSFQTLLRLRGALFRHFWGPAPGYSFRTLFGLFRGSGPEGPGRPCVGRGRSQFLCLCGNLPCTTPCVANCHYLTLHDATKRYLMLIDAIPFHKKKKPHEVTPSLISLPLKTPWVAGPQNYTYTLEFLRCFHCEFGQTLGATLPPQPKHPEGAKECLRERRTGQTSKGLLEAAKD